MKIRVWKREAYLGASKVTKLGFLLSKAPLSFFSLARRPETKHKNLYCTFSLCLYIYVQMYVCMYRWWLYTLFYLVSLYKISFYTKLAVSGVSHFSHSPSRITVAVFNTSWAFLKPRGCLPIINDKIQEINLLADININSFRII